MTQTPNPPRASTSPKWRQAIVPACVLILIGGALTLRYLSDQNDPRVESLHALIRRVSGIKEPPAHRLTLRATLKPSLAGVYFDPFFRPDAGIFDIKIQGLPDLSKRELEGPLWKWTREAPLYRAAAAGSWVAYHPSAEVQAAYASTKENAPPVFREPGFYRVPVHGTVEFYDADTNDTWKGEIAQNVDVSFSSADVQRALAKWKQEQAKAAQLKHQKHLDIPPGTPMLAKLQWGRSDEGPWRDVPSDPHAAPLLVSQDSVIGFRVIYKGSHPPLQLEWGFGKPAWGGAAGPGIMGDTTWVKPGEKGGPGSVQTISVEYGNTLSTKVRIVPDWEMTAEATQGVAYGKGNVVLLGAAVEGFNAASVPGARMHFILTRTDPNHPNGHGVPIASMLASINAAGQSQATLKIAPQPNLRVQAILEGPYGEELTYEDAPVNNA